MTNMIFDIETLGAHLGATLVGFLSGLVWWSAAIFLFHFDLPFWFAATVGVLSSNLTLLSLEL